MNKLINKRIDIRVYSPYFIIALLYVFLHMKYMPEYIDDAWVLSWAYGFKKWGDITDYVFGYVNTRGSILFGTGYAFVYGNILNLVGWSRSNAVIISTLFIWANSFTWFKITGKLGYTKNMRHIVSILLLVMEIYFALGNKLRSDSMTLFIISVAFYLFISGKYFWSGLLAMISFEIHAISLTFFFYILAYLFSIFNDMKLRPKYYIKGALIFILGVTIGIAYYIWIQWDYLNLFFKTTTGELGGHTIFSYMWKMKYAKRHLPELVIIIVSLFLFLKDKMYKKENFILPFLILTLLSTFLLKRGNYHYTAFVYPSVILLIAYVITEYKKVKLFFILLTFYLIPQYGYLFYLNKDYNQDHYEALLLSHFPDKNIEILGNSGAWFALKEHNFKEYGYYKRRGTLKGDLPSRFYLISDKKYRDNVGDIESYNEDLFSDYIVTKCSEFSRFNYEDVDILLYTRYTNKE